MMFCTSFELERQGTSFSQYSCLRMLLFDARVRLLLLGLLCLLLRIESTKSFQSNYSVHKLFFEQQNISSTCNSVWKVPQEHIGFNSCIALLLFFPPKVNQQYGFHLLSD